VCVTISSTCEEGKVVDIERQRKKKSKMDTLRRIWHLSLRTQFEDSMIEEDEGKGRLDLKVRPNIFV